jgi:hypothetical protein
VELPSGDQGDVPGGGVERSPDKTDQPRIRMARFGARAVVSEPMP